MKKLSIVIPVYNVEHYLAKCLDSVIYPALDGYEIIVVNDGSTDSSPEIARGYAEKYPQLIRLISTPNGGLGHARNTGIDASVGEYLLFLDSDDRLNDGALPEIMQTLAQDFDICVFDFITVNEQGRRLSYTAGCEKDGVFSLESYPELLFQPPNACMKLWRRSLFLENHIRFPDRMWYEDLSTSARLYLHAQKILSVHRPWYVYLMRPGSITNSANLPRNLEIITAVNIVLDYYKQQGKYEQYQPRLEYMAFYHQLLTSTTRVNLIDRKSDIQDKLLEDYTAKFPHFRENPYVRSMCKKYKLLLFFICHKWRFAMNYIMRLNNLVRRKNS